MAPEVPMKIEITKENKLNIKINEGKMREAISKLGKQYGEIEDILGKIKTKTEGFKKDYNISSDPFIVSQANDLKTGLEAALRGSANKLLNELDLKTDMQRSLANRKIEPMKTQYTSTDFAEKGKPGENPEGPAMQYLRVIIKEGNGRLSIDEEALTSGRVILKDKTPGLPQIAGIRNLVANAQGELATQTASK